MSFIFCPGLPLTPSVSHSLSLSLQPQNAYAYSHSWERQCQTTQGKGRSPCHRNHLLSRTAWPGGLCQQGCPLWTLVGGHLLGAPHSQPRAWHWSSVTRLLWSHWTRPIEDWELVEPVSPQAEEGGKARTGKRTGVSEGPGHHSQPSECQKKKPSSSHVIDFHFVANN